MKKFAALLISLSFLLSLVACGGEPAADDSTAASEPASSSVPAESEIPTTAETEAEEKISLEEITVIDNEQCLVKITGIDPDGMWGYSLNAYFENRSADQTYMFAVDSAAVNGVQTDPFFAAEVAAGKKSNEVISFSDSTLSENGIDSFSDIELSFRVYDSEDWSADDVVTETVHVYPYGEENATLFVREPQDSDTVIVDNDDCTVIVTGYMEDEIWGYTMNLYLVNKTDRNLMFSVDNASVNGFMSDPFWATSVIPGKVQFARMAWSNDELAANDITVVEELEMEFSISDADDWSADDLFHETITLNP